LLKRALRPTIHAQSRTVGRHRVLDADGIVAPGEFVVSGDFLVNKMTPLDTKNPLPLGTTSLGEDQFRCQPQRLLPQPHKTSKLAPEQQCSLKNNRCSPTTTTKQP
jgi:hypothetical protein